MIEVKIGEQYTISGMIMEILEDMGDKWRVRNKTTGTIVEIDKSILIQAWRLGKAVKS